MPVMIWMSSIVIDALPNTYHHPIGPSIDRGTGWSIIGSIVSLKPTRASNQLPSFLSQLNIVDVMRILRVCPEVWDSVARELGAAHFERANRSGTCRAAAGQKRARRRHSRRRRGKGT